MDEQTLHHLERYFDGSLSSDEKRDFEARLRSDAPLQDVVRQQQAINSALRRLVALPVMPPAMIAEPQESVPVAGADVAGVIARSPSQTWLRRFAIAAVVCAGLFGVWSTWNQLKPIDDGREVVQLTVEEYYRQQVAAGMKPYYVCDPKTDEFAREFKSHFGQGLLMNDEVPGFKCAGVARCNSLSPNTLAVLTWMNDTPVIVLIDRKQCNSPAPLSPASGLHLYQRDIGSLVLYEVSPIDHPQVLALFKNPDDQG